MQKICRPSSWKNCLLPPHWCHEQPPVRDMGENSTMERPRTGSLGYINQTTIQFIILTFMKQAFFSLLLFGMAWLAQAVPPPPQVTMPQETLEAVFGEVRLPFAGTSAAELHRAEGFLELPLKFGTPPPMRLVWDLSFPLDLTDDYGVELDFYVSDLEAIDQSNLFLYFHSGEGWYRLPFEVRRAGEWNHVVLSKATADIEEHPAGWGKLDCMRISVGCFEDPAGAVAAIANLRPCQRNGEVLVIPAVSCGRANPNATGYKYYAEKTTDTLEALNVSYMTVPDTDVTEASLRGVRLVVLPHNPQLPEGLAALLQGFVGRGGKLLAAYNLPEEVATLLGVQLTGWKRCEGGKFQGYRATADALANQPAQAVQVTSNTHIAQLTGEGRVIANWITPDGADSGMPAALATPNGLYLGCPWLGVAERETLAFYQAMLAELAPEVWRQAVTAEFENIGVLKEYKGLEDIRGRMPAEAPAEALAALERAFALREQAKACINNHNLFKASELCKQSQDCAMEALCRLATPGPADEQRAFWCHSAFGLPGKSWDEAIKFLSDNGFNAIIGNFLWPACAYYPSEVLPAYRDLGTRGDQLRQCLDACRKYGVKCHLWMVCWNMGGERDPEFVKRMNDEHRTQVSFSGKPEPLWLCPSHPDNRRLVADAMLEAARNYPDLAGLHFDYIRYPGNDYCFCDGCRKRFEERLGRPVANWPADLREAPLDAEWQQFRCDQISALVKLVHDGAKALRPELQLSAAVFKNYRLVKEYNGQDWSAWCREGWLDFVCPMDYTASSETHRGLIRRQLPLAHGVRVCPGIGLSLWKKTNRPLTMIEQIENIRQFNLPGFTVFNYDETALEPLPLLRLGCTSNRPE